MLYSHFYQLYNCRRLKSLSYIQRPWSISLRDSVNLISAIYIYNNCVAAGGCGQHGMPVFPHPRVITQLFTGLLFVIVCIGDVLILLFFGGIAFFLMYRTVCMPFILCVYGSAASA